MQGLTKVAASILSKVRTSTPRPEAVKISELCRGNAMVELLLSKGDILASDENGWTPLHSAALNGHQDICGLLIAHGAKSTPKAYSRDTASMASDLGRKEVVEVLIAAGAT
jgi:ankyrin repeat protein